jgi:glycosyltransferase involved in cell wall biosynthesis
LLISGFEYLKSIAGPTVEFLGHVADQELEKVLMLSKAFLFASVDEEFGIAPIEAMGYGIPVIAYKSGGLIETVKDGVNGYLFDELSEKSLIEKIKLLESLPVDVYRQMRKNAWEYSGNFSEEKFKQKILKFIGVLCKKAKDDPWLFWQKLQTHPGPLLL